MFLDTHFCASLFTEGICERFKKEPFEFEQPQNTLLAACRWRYHFCVQLRVQKEAEEIPAGRGNTWGATKMAEVVELQKLKVANKQLFI